MSDHYLKKELYDLIKTDESIFEFIQKSSLDGLWYWDLEKPENEWMDEQFWTILGYDPKDMPHSPDGWQNIIFEDDLKVALDNFHKHLADANHPYDQIVRYRHKKGHTVWIHCRGVAIRDGNGKPLRMLGAHHDITEQKREELRFKIAQERTLESIANINAIIENTDDSVWAIDKEYKITFVNHRFREDFKSSFGHELQIGDNLVKHLPEPIQPIYRERYDRALNNERFKIEDKVQIGENQFIYIEISFNPILSDGKVIGASFWGRNVTEDRLKQEELIRAKEEAELSRERFELAMVATSDGLMDWDLVINQIYFSPRWKEILGYKDHELPNAFESWKNNTRKEDVEKATALLNNNIENRINDYEVEVQMRHKLGHYVDILAKASIFYDENGKAIRVVGTHKDITDIKKAEEKLKRQNQELKESKEKAVESDRLKSEFINNMSHEIRTPMNGIMGFSRMLNKKGLSDEKREHYINILYNSGKQLLRIIDDIIEISQLNTQQVKVIEKEVALNDILLELFSVFDTKAKENNTPLYLIKPLKDEESIINTDESKLKKVLSNLIENALKYTNKGSVEIGYRMDKHGLDIYVKDTGIGIPKAKQKIIFERFSRESDGVANNVGGLGLGLAIAVENVELLGGKIELKSELGVGSEFTIKLPNARNIESVSTTNKEKKSVKKPVVLIAEDEEINFLYVETLIKEQLDIYCDTIHAKDGKEAVKLCRENNDICLVLMDIKMPEMDGYKATNEIKKFRSDLPIVAQTAYSTREDQDKAFKAGFDDFFSKPIDEKVLEGIIKKYIET